MTTFRDLLKEKGALARHTDPETSHAAARYLNETGKVTEKEEAVLQSLIRLGGRGNTDRVVEESGMEWNTVSPRMRPLFRKGLIIEDGKEKGKSGRSQIVWCVTDLGRKTMGDGS